jgi:hypothetical protein
VEYGIVPIVPIAVAPPVQIARYATVPRATRCVRGRAVGVRAANDTALRWVRLSAGKRGVTARRGKRAQLALKRRSTRVTLTVRLRDGRTGTQSFTYRRCG